MSKRRTPSSGGFRLLPENVVQLGSFRQRRSGSPSHTVFYLHEKGTWLNLLNSFTCLQVEDITSPAALRAKLMTRKPGLVLLEAELRWAEPVETIRQLEALLKVPIVMVCEAALHQRNTDLIKRAYAAGVYETLFAPLRREELFETLEVLLKFQSHVSLHQ